jgi:hypothetical protein
MGPCTALLAALLMSAAAAAQEPDFTVDFG